MEQDGQMIARQEVQGSDPVHPDQEGAIQEVSGSSESGDSERERAVSQAK